MDDLTTWLLKQIDEDERVAAQLAADGYPKHDCRVLSVEGTMEVPWPDRWNPVLVLRECEAKRRLVRRHEMIIIHERGRKRACRCCGYGGEWPIAWPCDTARDIASMYAGRPGYREEWRAVINEPWQERP